MTIDTQKQRAQVESVIATLREIHDHRRRHVPTREWRNRREQLDNALRKVGE